jgi:predicted TIM-barrel fold metal-dependent hydrolase
MMILVPHSHLHLIDDVAARYPGLKIAMDHLALTSGKYDADNFGTLDKLLALAKRPNVAVKASALPCYTKDTYPFRSLDAHLKRVYDAFGPKRMFWGTDLSRSPIPYRQHVTWWRDEIRWLSAEDREWIMGRGICEWLGWKMP